ncbi:tryptophan transaminase [Malassezia psittaci]|uniref:Tryptophan transaminase n=1 Tax=Malassezia psittaci TaxID=1821823 RepID=A0AAF0JL50_9BASI|nr:tryptophan transaminase [Malassezia psittaci]
MPLESSELLSRSARSRPASAIRSLLPLEKKPNMISLLAGKPNPNGFPFESITLQLKPSAEAGSKPSGEPMEITIKGSQLEKALQYGSSAGDEGLLGEVDKILSRVHHRTRGDGQPAGEFGLTLGNGSQDLLSKAISVLFDPEDTILVESPVYPGVLPELVTHKVQICSVESDEQGLSAKNLRETLQSWKSSEKTKHLKFPKAVYTVPTGANPAGTTASTERKREILAIAREFSVLVLEDDPYYFVTFENLTEDASSPERALSYFELENEQGSEWGYGYVLRFESFSKILSAGVRLGFSVGPKPLIDAMVALTASTNLHASGASQAIAGELIQYWGVDGFLRHVTNVARMYKERRDMFGRQLDTILGGESEMPLATYVTPVAGMFYWIKLHLPPTPEAPEGDSYQVISQKALEFGVLAMPGAAFFADQRKTPYVRASFSLIQPDEAREALFRLRKAVLSAWEDAGYETVPRISS